MSLLTLRASHSSLSAWSIGWRKPGGASLGGQRSSSLGRVRKPETFGGAGGAGVAGMVAEAVAVEAVVVEKIGLAVVGVGDGFRESHCGLSVRGEILFQRNRKGSG